MTIPAAIDDFLAQSTIAIAGISGTNTMSPANLVYDKMKKAGYKVYAVTTGQKEFQGKPCYATVAQIAGSVDGVFIACNPEQTEKIVDSCIAAGVPRIWMHNMLGTQPSHWKSGGSVSEAGVEKARQAGISVISGSCPMQFLDPDLVHRCIRFCSKITGGLQ